MHALRSLTNHSRHLILSILAISLLSACASQRVIVTPEFSFTQYDTVAFARPDNQQTIPLYGIDLELGNALTKKGFKVIGEKELSSAPDAVKQKTLLVQMHLSTTTRRSIVSATFSSAATGKSELSVMDIIKGDLSDGSDLRTFCITPQKRKSVKKFGLSPPFLRIKSSNPVF